MKQDKCAEIRMEENYMRLTVDYSCKETSKSIEKAIIKVEKAMKTEVEVLKIPDQNNSGTYSIEFKSEGCQRFAGDFFKLFLEELKIKKCSY